MPSIVVTPMAVVVQFIVWQGGGKALIKKCRGCVAMPPGSLDARLTATERLMLAKSNIGKKPGNQAD
jgi:hypothetical protein